MQANRHTVELTDRGFVVVDSHEDRQVLAPEGEPGTFDGAYHSRARARREAAELDAAAAEWLEAEALSRWAARTIREGEANATYGFARGAVNCTSCGCFKSEPAAVCSYCGDDPVSYNGSRVEFNRAYGRAA